MEYQNCSTCMKQNVCSFVNEFKDVHAKLNEVGKNYNKFFEITLRCKEYFQNKVYRDSPLSNFFNIGISEGEIKNR